MAFIRRFVQKRATGGKPRASSGTSSVSRPRPPIFDLRPIAADAVSTAKEVHLL
ncbi:hypothetical protein [Rhodovulum steppense]|uniref:hypothetical protein n=1 Tax=Rhodovulum steppense TaxID=540251 RepID=UPI00140498FF|nr:hypothetical protein [Rhodovulum steppense]